MKPSPLQWSLCVTCLVLLVAKLWDWWQGLGRPAAWPESGSLNVGLPLSVVAPELSGFSAPAVAPHVSAPHVSARAPEAVASFRAPEPVPVASFAPAPVAPVPHHAPAAPDAGAAATAILDAFAFGDDDAVELPFPTPMALPHEEPPPATITRLTPRSAPPVPAPAPAHQTESPETRSELRQQLVDLAARELAAARLRAKSMLLNAEVQARTALDEGERLAGALTEQVAAQPPPTGPDLGEARRQGQREGHAIGLRKGEMEALGRIEQVFAQIEGLLDPVSAPRAVASGLTRRNDSW